MVEKRKFESREKKEKEKVGKWGRNEESVE